MHARDACMYAALGLGRKPDNQKKEGPSREESRVRSPAAGAAALPLLQVDRGKMDGGPIVQVAHGAGKLGARIVHALRESGAIALVQLL